MTNRKNYNSILFLTVYLGLVLVGGSSHVFAYAATNSIFDIRNEIEFKEDLDNKPDEEINFDDYFNNLKWFVEDLQELHKTEKFGSNQDDFQISEARISLCGLETTRHERVSTYSNKVSNDDLRSAVELLKRRFEDYGFYGDCSPNDSFDKQKAVNYSLKLEYDKTAFTFELSFLKQSPQKATLFTEKANQGLSVFKFYEDEIITKSLHENTKVLSSNNQVFIVTRLPRGSIDSLLK